MREILFRGRDVNSNEWRIGYFYTAVQGCVAIIGDGVDGYQVKPETVGQYTGLIDKKGKKIFEGDIIKYRHHGINEKAVIRYGAPENRYTMYGWYLDDNQGNTAFRLSEYFIKDYNCQVIGNIYDNPELMEVDCNA